MTVLVEASPNPAFEYSTLPSESFTLKVAAVTVPDEGEGLPDTEGLTDGEIEGDTLTDGLTDTLGDTDGDTEGLFETDGLTDTLGLTDGEILGDVLDETEGEELIEIDGLTLDDTEGLVLIEGLVLTLGDTEGLILGDTETEGLTETEGDTEGLFEGDTLPSAEVISGTVIVYPFRIPLNPPIVFTIEFASVA